MPAYPTTTNEEVMTMSKPLINSIGPGFSAIDHERFKAKFGVRVEICTRVWNMIILKLNKSPAMTGFGRLSVVHILYGLFFL